MVIYLPVFLCKILCFYSLFIKVKKSTERLLRTHIKNILSEIFDYEKKDIDEMDDVYTGAVYLSSEHPITLDELQKRSTVNVQLSNRADASATNTEYIYRIKTKKPLYKRGKSSLLGGLDLEDFLDDIDISGKESKKPKINVDDFSGYFTYHSTFQELYAVINPADIISFKLIGGFAKYDKHPHDKPSIELSEKTDDFLYSYISGTILHKTLTPEIFEELKPFKPKGPVKIYKGIEEVQIRHSSAVKPPYKTGQKIEVKFNHMTSWSINPLIARRFIDDYPSTQPFVIEMVAQPESIVVDVRTLPKEYYHTNQREIIMSPGDYVFKIVWAGK